MQLVLWWVMNTRNLFYKLPLSSLQDQTSGFCCLSSLVSQLSPINQKQANCFQPELMDFLIIFTEQFVFQNYTASGQYSTFY